MLHALQINKKNYTLSCNRRNFEDSGKVLAISVSELYQSISDQLCQPMVITTVSVQIDNYFYNT